MLLTKYFVVFVSFIGLIQGMYMLWLLGISNIDKHEKRLDSLVLKIDQIFERTSFVSGFSWNS